MTRKILILGATSAIARATAKTLAKQGNELLLAGRDMSELERISADLTVRFANHNHVATFDIENISQHQKFFDSVLTAFGSLDGIIFAIGYMGSNVEKTLTINFVAAVSLLNICADYLASKQQGFIVAISSVAGDRGRQSNYIYGAAKSGLSTYLQGLRNRLCKNNVKVITIKPGFVDTAMTFGLPGLFLVAKPQVIGDAIARAIDKTADVLYLPWFWRYIMLMIMYIPEKIFKKMSL